MYFLGVLRGFAVKFSKSENHPRDFKNTVKITQLVIDSFAKLVYTKFMLARVYSCAVIGLDGVVV